MDNFKKCSKCGEVKLLDCFYKDKSRKDGHNCYCKKCQSEKSAKYKIENPEKEKSIKAKYRAENPEKVKASVYKWQSKNHEKFKSDKAAYVLNLNDSYIKNKIKYQTGLPYEHITQDLIETKRLHILIKRKLKDLTK